MKTLSLVIVIFIVAASLPWGLSPTAMAAGCPPGTVAPATRLPQDTTSYPPGVTYSMGPKVAGPFTVSAKTSEFTNLGTVLEKGKPYYIRGEGVVSFWGDWDHGVDSVYLYDHWDRRNVLEIWGALELKDPDIHLSEAIEKQTWGLSPKPAVYNPQHVYEGVVFGAGKPLQARVFDGGDYVTNSGNLTLTVYQAIPSATTGPGTTGATVWGLSPRSTSDSCSSNVFYLGVLMGFARAAIENNVDRNWAAAMLDQGKPVAAAIGLPTVGLDDIATRARGSVPTGDLLNSLNDYGVTVRRQVDRLCECPVFDAGTAFGVAEAGSGANLPQNIVAPALSGAAGALGECEVDLGARIGPLVDRLQRREPSLTVYPDIAAVRVDVQGNYLDSLCRCAFPSWAGKWATSYGVMILQVTGDQVTGTLDWKEGKIDGVISDGGRTLTGYWSQAPSYAPPRDRGGFVFRLDEDGLRWSGTWGYGENSTGDGWSGDRGAP